MCSTRSANIEKFIYKSILENFFADVGNPQKSFYVPTSTNPPTHPPIQTDHISQCFLIAFIPFNTSTHTCTNIHTLVVVFWPSLGGPGGPLECFHCEMTINHLMCLPFIALNIQFQNRNGLNQYFLLCMCAYVEMKLNIKEKL